MLNRLTVSLSVALLGILASTGAAHAATETEEVVIGTFLVAVALIVVLLIAYGLKRAFGLEKLPPPETDAGDHAH
jgi:hypothetical protein